MKKQHNNKFSQLNALIANALSHCSKAINRSFDALSSYYHRNVDSSNPMIRLMRLDKPIPIMLLVFPIWWTISISAKTPITIIFFSLFFFIGAILMRSAGCIVNDIFDRNIDKYVTRTKNRPLATNEVSIMQALKLLVILLFFSSLLLIVLPKTSVYFGILALIAMVIYPLMKRITYFAQIFLGFTFNIGVLIAWSSLTNTWGWPPFLLYAAAAFWTIAYDTIYAYQDIADDEKLNIKSMALKFKENGTKVIWLLYQISISLLCIAGLQLHMNMMFYAIIAFAFYIVQRQLIDFDSLDSDKCRKQFNANLEFAFIVLIAILLGRL